MRIVFVGGSQRSGTTLVQTLIANALPNVPILPEAHIICDLMGAFRHAKAAWSKTSLYYEDHESLARYFRSAVEAHVTDIERRYGKLEFLVLKDPSFIRFMPELTESFPDAAQIMCVRDPRDIVASYIKIGHRQRNKNRTTRYTKRRILPICRKINAAYQPLIDEPAQPGRILVRYEELVLRPGEILHQLSSTTGLPLKLNNELELAWLDDEHRHEETWRTSLEGGPPSPESVGSFRRELTFFELALVELACSSAMRFFNYQPAFKSLLRLAKR